MNTVSDLLERTAWTFAQAFVGVLVGVNVTSGSVNWREVLISATVAGLVAALKVLGVKGSQVTTAKTLANAARTLPEVKKAEEYPAVQTSEEVARRVARELVNS